MVTAKVKTHTAAMGYWPGLCDVIVSNVTLYLHTAGSLLTTKRSRPGSQHRHVDSHTETPRPLVLLRLRCSRSTETAARVHKTDMSVIVIVYITCHVTSISWLRPHQPSGQLTTSRLIGFTPYMSPCTHARGVIKDKCLHPTAKGPVRLWQALYTFSGSPDSLELRPWGAA